MPKHLGESRHGGMRRRAWKVVAPVVAIVGGVAAGLLGVGGSYALWTSSAAANVGDVQTGTVGLTAQWAAGHSDAAWANLLPGESARANLALTNIGDAGLAIFASTLGIANGFEVRIAAGTCPAAPLTGPASGTGAAPVATAAAPGASIVIAAGQSAPVCLEVRATAATAPGQTVAFETEFEGRQVQ